MRFYKFAFCLSLTLLGNIGLAQENVPTGASETANAVSSASFAQTEKSELGDWFWLPIDDPLALSGGSSIAGDADDPQVLYVGGPGYVAVSRDGGETWRPSLAFQAPWKTGRRAALNLDEGTRADRLREYLRNELESQFDSGFVESLLEDIRDEELLTVEDASDIEALQNLTLEMDTDLREVLSQDLDASDEDVDDGALTLTDFDSYAVRFHALTGAGADNDVAARDAARSSSPWQILTRHNAVYVVLSGAIYQSQDAGKTWLQIAIPAQEDQFFLSMDIAADGQTLVVGTTDGIMVSRNAGISWTQAPNDPEGAVFEMHWEGNDIWAQTTEGRYRANSTDMRFAPVETKLGVDILQSVPDGSGNFLAMTESGLAWYNGIYWEQITTAPFELSEVRGISKTDAGRMIVITESGVYMMERGIWLNMSRGLSDSDTGAIKILNNSNGYFAIMVSASGIWGAKNEKELLDSGVYRDLMAFFENEPSDADVIQAAIDTHFLGSWLDKNWDLRSYFSWLLPEITFEYSFKQKSADNIKSVLDEATYQKTYTYRYDRHTESQWRLMGRWTLKFDKTFKDGLSIEQRVDRLKQKRNKLASEILKDLKKRRLMIVKSWVSKSKKNTLRQVKEALTMQEIETRLNILTGGYYMQAVKKNKQP